MEPLNNTTITLEPLNNTEIALDVPEAAKIKAEKVKKPKIEDALELIAELELKLSTLTKAFEKVTSLVGRGNELRAFGLKRWVPGREDMTRYK